MARQYKRDAKGQFARGNSASAARTAAREPAPAKQSRARKAAKVAGAALAVGAIAGGIKVNNIAVAANARYDARAAAAALRAMNG